MTKSDKSCDTRAELIRAYAREGLCQAEIARRLKTTRSAMAGWAYRNRDVKFGTLGRKVQRKIPKPTKPTDRQILERHGYTKSEIDKATAPKVKIRAFPKSMMGV